MVKLHKTDKRFNLYRFGFDCYVEFQISDFTGYNLYKKYCKDKLGPEFSEFAGRVYGDGNWRSVACYQNRRWRSKRIYLRGEKYHTLLLVAMPLESKETIYL
jgi:hypothetical protein